jgi:hypothetical protein
LVKSLGGGTNVTLLDKPKFCTLAAEIFKKATL